MYSLVSEFFAVASVPIVGMGPAAEPLLVHYDRHARVLNGIGVRLGVARQEGSDEHAEILVHLTLRLGRDGVEDDRRFAAGEDRDLAFGDAQRDVLEIILARTAISMYPWGIRRKPWFHPFLLLYTFAREPTGAFLSDSV